MCTKPLWGKAYRPGENFQSDNFLRNNRFSCLCNDWPVGNRMIYKEQDPAPWGANEVYRLYSEEGWWTYTYLLCYEDQIIEIRFDWEPTAEQMAIVSQKLNS